LQVFLEIDHGLNNFQKKIDFSKIYNSLGVGPGEMTLVCVLVCLDGIYKKQ